MARAISISELLQTKFNTVKLPGPWGDAIGDIEPCGSILIWGHSANGKTVGTLQLTKELCAAGIRVVYNSKEEGRKRTFQRAAMLAGIADNKRRMVVLNKESVDEVKDRLRKRKSPGAAVFDSVQHCQLDGLTKSTYKEMLAEFPNKLFIFTSHADGRDPKGELAKFIRYDADVKIWIEGYRAFVETRYGYKGEVDIWEEGARDYWSTK